MSELREAEAFLRACLPEGGRVLCAVSGGLDSMCLLHFAVGLEGFSVTAAHFNHQLRGEESDRDEAFVRNWCAAHEVPDRKSTVSALSSAWWAVRMASKSSPAASRKA